MDLEGALVVGIDFGTPANARAHDVVFAEYSKRHEYVGRGANEVVRRLREVRRDARTAGERS